MSPCEAFIHAYNATELLVVAILVLVLDAEAVSVARATTSIAASDEALGHRDALLVAAPSAAEAVILVVVLVAGFAAVVPRGRRFILYK